MKNGALLCQLKNQRINITLEEPIAGCIFNLAKQENKSKSLVANDLILEALEYREDLSLSNLAKVRDIQKAKRISHKDAWK
jgi:hypothetical protein